MADPKDPSSQRAEVSVQTFLTFRPYPLHVGQKLFIEGGPRRGDWEVIGLSERKVKLRCPFSGREVEWDRFCYLVEERTGTWPHPD
jgi:hypothetical protein